MCWAEMINFKRGCAAAQLESDESKSSRAVTKMLCIEKTRVLIINPVFFFKLFTQSSLKVEAQAL